MGRQRGGKGSGEGRAGEGRGGQGRAGEGSVGEGGRGHLFRYRWSKGERLAQCACGGWGGERDLSTCFCTAVSGPLKKRCLPS